MGQLLRDMLAVATGAEWGFSWTVWAGISGLAIVGGLVCATVGQRMLDPVVVLVALRPGRVARWMALVAVASPGAFALLVFSFVGIPLAVLGFFGGLLATGLGYLAIAAVAGDRLARLAGSHPPPWVAMLIGIALLRLLRLVPLHVGAALHTAVIWAAYAAACAAALDLAWSWHRRRMPDHEQFAGEQLIEWHPPGHDQ